MSNDKYQQSMQNWKKEIIIDVTLNGLFDGQLSAQDYLTRKILTLPHQEVIKVYMKLTSLKHVITKNMQKQIELRHGIIEHSFQECLRSKNSYEDINQQALRDSLKQIQRFNEKYELISQRVNEIKNINKILHFSKALEKFKVNARLLKSMMQDFEQNSTSKIQSELINTLKISKIIMEISIITVKFDFSGVKSFEEERHFINNTKGAIFGLVERDLTAIFGRLANVPSHRRSELEKDIVNKFIILNNIMKLKDFCIPFYKNTLKQMSELLKKSLVIGQSVDQRDPRAYLQTFEEYFTVSVRKRLVENGIIFISIDELLKRSNIKTPFNFNFFEKYWQNITGFMKDLITWSIQNDSKDWMKDKIHENLFEAFKVLESRNSIPKYLMAILWKYPILYESLTSISNQIHLHIIKNVEYQNYQFQNLKQQFIKVLLPLAQLYYKHAGQFYDTWKQKIQLIRSQPQIEECDNNVLRRTAQIFEDRKSNKDNVNISSGLKIIQWLISNLTTKEIVDYHNQHVLKIFNLYFNLITDSCPMFNSQSRDDYVYFINKAEEFSSKIKTVLKRGSVSQNSKLQPDFSNISSKEGILGSSSDILIGLIRACKSYQTWLEQARSRYHDII